MENTWSCLLVLCLLPHHTSSWQQWMYTSQTPPSWQAIWGFPAGPRLRRGQSLVIHGDQSRVIMFGGRDNEILAAHNPKTYEVVDIDGTLEFRTYEQLEVGTCSNETADIKSSPYSFTKASQPQENCTNHETVGLYYNDVWQYNINCKRFGDLPCWKSGWTVLHPGATLGGCKYYLGREVCTVPTERWYHGAAMFNDSTMIIHGGFSQHCEDYCDDMWSFDLRDNTWTEIYMRGDLSNDPDRLPGKRWRFTALSDGKLMWIFGGHRLWQGFASDNSAQNNWENYDQLPKGGYLNDLWVWEKKILSPIEQVPLDSVGYGNWTQLKVKTICNTAADGTITCEFGDWPSERAAYAATLDEQHGGLWVHGGYRTYFPYISTDGPGSARGASSVGSGGFIPYPTYPYYLDDLWFYNFSTGIWKQVVSQNGVQPKARCDHQMVKAGEVLLLFGGYADNYYYDDTWQFNISASTWLLKTVFVWPIYPPNCTDDMKYIQKHNCTQLLWEQTLQRNSTSPYPIKSYSQQPYYYPNPEYSSFLGILNKGETYNEQAQLDSLYTGMPLGRYQAIAPREWAMPTVQIYHDNGTKLGVVWQRCTSVWGEPTRGTLLDGLFGRSSQTIFIAQPRRQAPGWDGCRDRADGRDDLQNILQWVHPSQRSEHRMVYSRLYDRVLMYGGLGYLRETLPTLSASPYTAVLSDFWVLGMHHCVSNCSQHGVCDYGFCICDPGYYGFDCSNISCPGDYCYYDDNKVQICSHCCYGGYNHTDADVYVSQLEKVPCSNVVAGASNGICDGWGTCQCAPPFIGDDCAIKDCKSNCSFNGWCSVEFPVSRCMCNPGYYGEICQYQECLNNCTYPNGICNIFSGLCGCNTWLDPYNNTRGWYSWMGEDCSYVVAYAAGCQQQVPVFLSLSLLLLLVLSHL